MPRINDRQQRDMRKAEALTRQQARAQRTPEQQLDLLDERAPRHATKERAKLHKQIAQSNS